MIQEFEEVSPYEFYNDLLAQIKKGERDAVTDAQLKMLKTLFPEEDFSELAVVQTPQASTPNDGRSLSEGGDFSGRQTLQEEE